ncbi:MAG: M20/M25/M40 family metallo-hydrolase, partial [Thermoplasmata archaeon]
MDESADLVELLEAYSPSGVEGPGTAAFEKIAHRLGYSVEIDEVGNGIASLGSGRPQILFLGHVDTVPGELPVRRDEHRVYGRGACDAKGPLVAALH